MHLPLHLGGEPHEAAKAYRSLKSAEGVGGSARDETGIDGLWRRSRAFGMAAGTSAYRRAVVNAFPHLATDLLPYYERRLGITPAPGSSEAERQAEVAALWPAKASNVWADIEAELKRIDARFVLVPMNDDMTSSSHPGRYLAPHPGASEEAFGGKGYSDFAYYTSRFHLTVSLPVGALANETRRLIDTARRRLRNMLPAHWTFRTITNTDGGAGGTGFILGVSPLGFTAMRSNS